MRQRKFQQEARTAREVLLRLLSECAKTDDDCAGAGQFILSDGTTEHIGVYGTSAIIETMSLCQPNWLRERLGELQNVLLRLTSDEDDEHYSRDRLLTFKLCAALNATSVVPESSRSEDTDVLHTRLIELLFSLQETDDVLETAFWPFAKSEAELSKRSYVLPTAYAVNALLQAGIQQVKLNGAIKGLAHYLSQHLERQEALDPHELVHVLLALNSANERERNKHIKTSDLRKADHYLYQHLLYNPHFEATYVNYTIRTPKFQSLFYVVKTNLTILKYFLVTESKYLKSNELSRLLQQLVKSVVSEGRFIDRANRRSAVRENALALRVIELILQGTEKRSNPTSNILLSFFFKYVMWNPTYRLFSLMLRVAVLAALVVIPIANYFWLDNQLESVVAVCASILAAFVYEHLRRSW